MAEYTDFAYVYDMFMDNVPYEKWGKYLTGLLKSYKVKSGLVAELGCGTGKMTRILKAAGYDMIGIDISERMLQIAREQEPEGDDSILYLEQDMREFELYGTVAAVVSICDSINYITDPEDLEQVFKLVNNYLDPGGVFIFDVNTPYYYRSVLGEGTFCENRPEGSFIWENFYDTDTKINEFDLTIYYDPTAVNNHIASQDSDGRTTSATEKKASKGGEHPLYERCEETHYQRAYSVDEIKRIAKKAGLKFEAVYEACTKDAPGRTTERVYFIFREQGKTK